MSVNFLKNLFRRISIKEKVFLARQLATMLSSGLEIDHAFKILESQTRGKYLKSVYRSIISDLEQGNSLSFAISHYPTIFDPVFVAIVRSGESTGQLDKVLSQLADRLEITHDFNSRVRSALVYPAFIVTVMIGILITMMIYVVPQLKLVFEDSNIPLPWTTNTIIGISNFTVNYWWVEIIGALLLITAGYLFFHSERGGSLWDRLKLEIPIARELYIEIYMARFCRTMSMLIKAGVPIMETIAISADVISNRVYYKSLKFIASQVERGIPMSVPMQKDKNFPPLVSEMVSVGEQTGKMEIVLTKMGDFYEKETDNLVKGLSGLIEPAIIVIIAFGVGFLVFSIITPIYSIANVGF